MLSRFDIFCVSRGRARYVPKVRRLCAPKEPCFVVDVGETRAYVEAGARRVIEGGGLCASRNEALKVARAEFVVLISDDLITLKRLDCDATWSPVRGETLKDRMQECGRRVKRAGTRNVGVCEAAEYVIDRMIEESAMLGGAYPTTNLAQAFYAGPVSRFLFVVGDFHVIRRSCPLRFDTRLTLKEDYDYCLQHLDTYGKVARCNFLIVRAYHYDNRGGVVDSARTNANERANVAYLMDKWNRRELGRFGIPSKPVIRPNPRRGVNEIRLWWPERASHRHRQRGEK